VECFDFVGSGVRVSLSRPGDGQYIRKVFVIDGFEEVAGVGVISCELVGLREVSPDTCVLLAVSRGVNPENCRVEKQQTGRRETSNSPFSVVQ